MRTGSTVTGAPRSLRALALVGCPLDVDLGRVDVA